MPAFPRSIGATVDEIEISLKTIYGWFLRGILPRAAASALPLPLLPPTSPTNKIKMTDETETAPKKKKKKTDADAPTKKKKTDAAAEDEDPDDDDGPPPEEKSQNKTKPEAEEEERRRRRRRARMEEEDRQTEKTTDVGDVGKLRWRLQEAGNEETQRERDRKKTTRRLRRDQWILDGHTTGAFYVPLSA